MTTAGMWSGGNVPAWTVADKLRKARMAAGLDQLDLARDIGISRNTVANYEGEKVQPRRPVLLAWAMRTGVSLEWLTQDERPRPDGDAGWAPTDSNRQPADYKFASSRLFRANGDSARPAQLPRRRGLFPIEPLKRTA